jgi:hypothetical protein
MLFALEGRGFEVLTFDLPRTTLIELAVYTRSEFTDFAFRIFSIFFYFVYVFNFALSADCFLKNIYF